jgi:hypothetical protein
MAQFASSVKVDWNGEHYRFLANHGEV